MVERRGSMVSCAMIVVMDASEVIDKGMEIRNDPLITKMMIR